MSSLRSYWPHSQGRGGGYTKDMHNLKVIYKIFAKARLQLRLHPLFMDVIKKTTFLLLQFILDNRVQAQ